jgi:PAT family beta-lactamase induction signal transducer AmpG
MRILKEKKPEFPVTILRAFGKIVHYLRFLCCREAMAGNILKSAYFNPRILAVCCLGFFSGLPLALTGSTLQAWLTVSNVNIVAIGALSLVGLPYVWKFLCAPLMDRFVPPRGGRRRGWIALTQISLCVTLWILASVHPDRHVVLVGMIALLIAFFSASQDIAIDAYRTDILRPEERGIGSAYFIFAYRVAMLVSGGLALVIADHWGWRFTYQLMAFLMTFSAIVTYFAPDVKESGRLPQNIWQTVKDSFKDLFQRDSIAVLLLFVVFYKLGDAIAFSLTTNFLLHGLGFTLTEVGLVYKTVSLLATLLGAFLGGALLVRINLYRALFLFGVAQAFSTLAFVMLAMIGKSFAMMTFAVFIENFCSGMGTTAFVAFLMSLCHQRYTATQYACLSALASIGRVCLGPVAGLMVHRYGWVSFYFWAFLLSFPGLILLNFLRTRMSFNANAVSY